MKIIMIVLSFIAIASSKELEVYVLAGQSNMAGHGWLNEILSFAPELQSLPSNVHIISETDRYVSENIGLPEFDETISLQRGYGEVTGFLFGPELSFAKRIGEAKNDKQILIIKVSFGGTDLTNQWKKNGSGLYEFLVYGTMSELPSPTYEWEGILNAISRIKSELGCDKITLSSFIWMQGESDAMDVTTAEMYSINLKAFIKNIRTDLAKDSLPFVIGKISSGPWPFGPIVRRMQQFTASEIPNVFVVETDDLPHWCSSQDENTCRLPSGLTSIENLTYGYGLSECHYDTEAEISLGYRFANCILNPSLCKERSRVYRFITPNFR